jgi:phage baseplate assembly protein W
MTASSLRFLPTEGLRTTATGKVAMAHGDESIRQAIMLLLGTTPGERLMRPTYGSHLNRLLFAPNDETTAGLAIHYVKQALQRWEPRIDVDDVDASADPDIPTKLNLILRYRVRQTLADEVLHYPLSLQPQGEQS